MTKVEELETVAVHRWQRYGWVLQIVGWLVMAAVIVLAALGLLAEGPLGERAFEDPAGNTVAFPRFIHRDTPATVVLEVSVDPGVEMVHVTLDDAFVHSVAIDRVSPTPTDVAAVQDGLEYRFSVLNTTRLTIDLRVTANTVGPIAGAVRVEDHPEMRLRQFVYP